MGLLLSTPMLALLFLLMLYQPQQNSCEESVQHAVNTAPLALQREHLCLEQSLCEGIVRSLDADSARLQWNASRWVEELARLSWREWSLDGVCRDCGTAGSGTLLFPLGTLTLHEVEWSQLESAAVPTKGPLHNASPQPRASLHTHELVVDLRRPPPSGHDRYAL